MSELILENLISGYEGKPVTENLNLTVNKGDYVFILGENGSGKTTLMKTILGLIEPISGKAVKNGGKTGYLPQSLELKKDFPASVKEIVLSGTLKSVPWLFYSKKDKETAMYNMKRLKIDNLAYECFRELSGGQKQKVLLARALCAGNDMLFLDEPVSGLDPLSTEEMYRILDELNSEGVTIIMISHDIAAAEKYASHVLHIGTPCFYLTKNEYMINKRKGM